MLLKTLFIATFPKITRAAPLCAKYSTESLDIAQKSKYYKGFVEVHDDEDLPDGWNEAQPYKNIPGPKALPLIGNWWRFLPGGEYYKISTDGLCRELTRKYGNIVRLNGIIGRRDMVYLFDPEDMEYVLRNSGAFPARRSLDSFTYYRTVLRKKEFKEFGGLITEQGESWFKFRTKVNPVLMQPKAFDNDIPKIDNIAKDFIKYIKHHVKQQGTNQTGDDFDKVLYRWAFESVTTVGINKRLGALDVNAGPDSEAHKLINSALRVFDAMYYLDILPAYWRYLPSRRLKNMVKDLDYITSVVRKHMEEELQKPVNENEELSALQRLNQADPNVAAVMVLDMFIAGVDTTGRTLGAALYYLAKNPDKQKSLREEILKFLPNKDSIITKEALGKMVYMKSVIKETTRLAPIAVGILRTTNQNLLVKGYQIPKNTDVLTIHIQTSAFTDKYFKEAQKFIPERWLRSTTDEYSFKNAHMFAYMPFGFGPRSCIGKRLANVELEVVLANVIRNYDLSWDQPEMEFSAKLLYGYTNPLKFTVKEVI